MSLDWSKYPNFTEDEFICSHTGKCRMMPYFMDTIQQIRTTIQIPLVLSSGYRDPTHPIEAAKPTPGEHAFGVGGDFLISGPDALKLISVAYHYGIRRIGIAQKGEHSNRFIHIGMGDKQLGFPEAMWSY